MVILEELSDEDEVDITITRTLPNTRGARDTVTTHLIEQERMRILNDLLNQNDENIYHNEAIRAEDNYRTWIANRAASYHEWRETNRPRRADITNQHTPTVAQYTYNIDEHTNQYNPYQNTHARNEDGILESALAAIFAIIVAVIMFPEHWGAITVIIGMAFLVAAGFNGMYE